MTSQATAQAVPATTAAPSSLLHSLLRTDRGTHQLPVRVALAAAMLPHGAQKAFGWFDGYGWDGTMGFLTGAIGMPAFVAGALILFELLGPLFLLVGLGTRVVGAGFVAIMVGAIATVHAEHGFFMNWSGTLAGEGYEYHILAIGLAVALVLAGGGRWSLDARLTRGK